MMFKVGGGEEEDTKTQQGTPKWSKHGPGITGSTPKTI